MSTIGELIIKIGADASSLSKGLDTATTKLEQTGSKMKSIGGALSAAITLPLVAVAGASFKMASDYNESLNKVDVAFKGNAKEVEKWASTTLKSYGIAKGTALDMAATFGDMATSMGLNTGQAADMSTKLVGLAGDLASFKNISIDVANTALNGVFTGETESLKQLGIVMTQVNLQEFAYSQGIQKKIQDMTQAEQVQLRYNYILAKTTNAQGDFTRTSGGAANQMRIFSESLKELGATFGEKFLPVLTPVITAINKLITAFSNINSAGQYIILAFVGLGIVIPPLIIVVGSLATALATLKSVEMLNTITTIAHKVALIAGTAATGAMTVATWLLNAALAVLTSPITLVVAALAAVVAIGYLVVKNWDTIKAAGGNAADYLKSKWGGFKDFFLGIWAGIASGMKGYVNGIIGNINAVIGALNAIHVKIPDWVPEYGGKAFSLNLEKVAYLAEGGIVTSPTLAMVGEAGTPEAVIPLNSRSARSALAGGGNGTGIDYDKMAAALIKAMGAANFIAQIDTSSRQMTLLERSLKPVRTSEALRGAY